VRIDHTKPVVIAAIHFLFPKSTEGRGDAEEINLIDRDMPKIVVKAPGALLVETKRGEDSGKK
jgi:hypothetical protein